MQRLCWENVKQQSMLLRLISTVENSFVMRRHERHTSTPRVYFPSIRSVSILQTECFSWTVRQKNMSQPKQQINKSECFLVVQHGLMWGFFQRTPEFLSLAHSAISIKPGCCSAVDKPTGCGDGDGLDFKQCWCKTGALKWFRWLNSAQTGASKMNKYDSFYKNI